MTILPPPAEAPPHRRKPWPWLLAIGAVVVSGFLLAQANSSDNTNATGPTTTTLAGDQRSAFSVGVGDCFNGEGEGEVEYVPVVSCTAPHLFEAFHSFSVASQFPPLSDYPGEEYLWDVADTRCLAAFDAFVGLRYEDSILDFGYLYPTATGWAAYPIGRSDREITCYLFDLNGSLLYGSMRGSRR